MRIVLLSRKGQRRFGGLDSVRNIQAQKAIAIALVLGGLITGCTAATEPSAEPEVSKSPEFFFYLTCLLYTSPSPRDRQKSRMPSSA